MIFLKNKILKCAIIVFTLFVLNLHDTYAVTVFDPSNFVKNTITSIKSAATLSKTLVTNANTLSTAVSTGNIALKENFLDQIAFNLANTAILKVKSGLVSAISNGGIDGGSAFLSNPDQFFLGIAKDQEVLVRKQLLGPEGSVLFNQNKNIYKLFTESLRLDSEVFKQSVTSSIGSTVCKKLADDIRVARSQGVDEITISRAQSNYNTTCTGSNRVAQNTNQQNCAKNYSCGGFDSILAVTQNLGRNTDAGRYEATRAKYEAEVAKKTDSVNKELDRGDGFLNKKKCSVFSEETNAAGEKICLAYESLSPGTAAAASLQKLITSPIDENLRVDEVGELVNSMASNFLTGLITGGISKAIENSKTAPSGTGSNSTGGSGEIPPQEDSSFELGVEGSKEYLFSTKPLINSARKGNIESRALVQKELSAYSATLDSYKIVDGCYIRKNSERIIPGSTAVPYPQSVPEKVSSRIKELSAQAVNLRNIIERSNSVDIYIDEKLDAMNKSTNLKVLDFYRNKIFEKIDSSDSLKDADWMTRDSENTYGPDGETASALYGLLAKEKNETLKNIVTQGYGDSQTTYDISPLAACESFNPNPQLIPIYNN
jgi:hypothetical protein